MPYDSMLSDEQRDIVAKARDFGLRYFTRNNIKKWGRENGLPGDIVKKFMSMDFGLMEYAIKPDRYERSLHTIALVLEELCRCAGAALPIATDLLDMYVLSHLGAERHARQILAEYERTGRLGFSFAVTEPQAGSDTRNIQTTVRRAGSYYVLNGHKTLVNNGEYTPLILVIAVDADNWERGDLKRPLSAWLVPYDAEGVRTYPIEKRGQRLLPFSDVVLKNVLLPLECCFSDDGLSYSDLNKTFQWGRVIQCATSVGMAQAAMDDAVRYADERRVAGSAIGEYQLIKEKLVRMEIALMNMRGLLYRAAISTDESAADARLNVALAKHFIPKASVEVASDAIQIFGGAGYTERERVYGIWEDCRGNQIAEGTDEIMVEIAAPLIKEKYLR